MTYLGAYTVGSTLTYLFTSRNSAGVPTALVSLASVDIYKDGGTTQATALGSLTTNFDSVAGLNRLVVASADSAAFFTADSEFAAVLVGIASVSNASIAGEVIASWSLNDGALPANSINSSTFSGDAFVGSTQSIALKPGNYSSVTVRPNIMAYSGLTVGAGDIAPGAYSGVTVGIDNAAGNVASRFTVAIGALNYSGVTVRVNPQAYSGLTVDIRPASLLSYDMGNSRLYQDAFHMIRNKVDASSSVASFYLTNDSTSLTTASVTTGSAGVVTMDPM